MLPAVVTSFLYRSHGYHRLDRSGSPCGDEAGQVAAGILFRHRAELHERLMVFALMPLVLGSPLWAHPAFAARSIIVKEASEIVCWRF